MALEEGSVTPVPIVDTLAELTVIPSRRTNRPPGQRKAWVLWFGGVLALEVIALVPSAFSGGAGIRRLYLILAILLVVILPPLAVILRQVELRTQRLVVNDVGLVVVRPFLGRRFIPRGGVAELRLASMSPYGGRLRKVAGPVVLILAANGSCLQRIGALRYSEDEIRRVSGRLRVPTSGSFAEVKTWRELDDAHPGTVQWWLRRPVAFALLLTAAMTVTVFVIVIFVLVASGQ